jgi:hypothetical protein
VHYSSFRIEFGHKRLGRPKAKERQSRKHNRYQICSLRGNGERLSQHIHLRENVSLARLHAPTPCNSIPARFWKKGKRLLPSKSRLQAGWSKDNDIGRAQLRARHPVDDGKRIEWRSYFRNRLIENIEKLIQRYTMKARCPFYRERICQKHPKGIPPNALDSENFHYISNVAIFLQDSRYTGIFCDLHDGILLVIDHV